MRVAIAGAGAVGRSIAQELIENGHQVLLIDKDPASIKPDRVPQAEWLLADACELSSLEEAEVDKCDVVIAATGDDKANLVELTLPEDSPYVGKPAGTIPWPDNCSLVTILRDGQVYIPTPDQPIESGDELLFVTASEVERELQHLLAPVEHTG
jgi:trk system potassium uptake protein TrkA